MNKISINFLTLLFSVAVVFLLLTSDAPAKEVSIRISNGKTVTLVVPPPATDAFVNDRCAAGQRLEYWTFAGLDHLTIVQPGTSLDDPLVAWALEVIGIKVALI